MEKKESSGEKNVVKKSVAFDPKLYKFIEEEITRQEKETGYKISRSAVVEAALKLLKQAREGVQGAKESLEEANKADAEKAAQAKKKKK